MKKKVTKPVAKTTRRSPRKTGSSGQSVLFQRIVIISACLTLVVAGVVFFNKQKVEQSVAGASIMKGLFMQGTVTMPTEIDNAVAYNIYYKAEGEKEFTNSVRDIKPGVTTYTISHLKKGQSYVYRFAAVDETGKEFLFSEVKPLVDVQPM